MLGEISKNGERVMNNFFIFNGNGLIISSFGDFYIDRGDKSFKTIEEFSEWLTYNVSEEIKFEENLQDWFSDPSDVALSDITGKIITVTGGIISKVSPLVPVNFKEILQEFLLGKIHVFVEDIVPSLIFGRLVLGKEFEVIKKDNAGPYRFFPSKEKAEKFIEDNKNYEFYKPDYGHYEHIMADIKKQLAEANIETIQ